MLENPLIPAVGRIVAPDLPGFGMRIKPEIWSHPAGQLRSTTF
jgi:pimeloyl-ACP methyl ester carboxylesterase